MWLAVCLRGFYAFFCSAQSSPGVFARVCVEQQQKKARDTFKMANQMVEVLRGSSDPCKEAEEEKARYHGRWE